jgi:hypothetical protein
MYDNETPGRSVVAAVQRCVAHYVSQTERRYAMYIGGGLLALILIVILLIILI